MIIHESTCSSLAFPHCGQLLLDYKPRDWESWLQSGTCLVSRRRLMAETEWASWVAPISPSPSRVSRILWGGPVTVNLTGTGELGFLQILMWHHWPRQQNFAKAETIYNGDHCARDLTTFVSQSQKLINGKMLFSVFSMSQKLSSVLGIEKVN